MDAKIDILRVKDTNGSEYAVYPKTLIKCVTNENGDNLEDTMRQFITDNLDAEVASKEYVAEQIAGASHLTREIVTEIPNAETAKDNVIYMLKVESASGNDMYQEYQLINGEVVMVGDTSVDLSGYVQSETVEAIIDGTTPVGNANKLGGKDASEYALIKADNLPNNTLASLASLLNENESKRFVYITAFPSDFPTNFLTGTVGDYFLTVTVEKVGSNIAFYELVGVYNNGTPFEITGYYNGNFFWKNTTADLANFVQGVSPYFVSGETILSWASNPNGVYKKFVIGDVFPSDVPTQAEGFVELKIDEQGLRRKVTFYQYGTFDVFEREIFNGAWRADWSKSLATTADLANYLPWNATAQAALKLYSPTISEDFTNSTIPEFKAWLENWINNGLNYLDGVSVRIGFNWAEMWNEGNTTDVTGWGGGLTIFRVNSHGSDDCALILKYYNTDHMYYVTSGISYGWSKVHTIVNTDHLANYFHTGNKPTGSYTGNGSATSRTISTGGLGSACIIVSPYMGKNALVLPFGAILFGAGGAIEYVSGFGFSDGNLTIATDNSGLNSSGVIYYYQTL